MGKKHNLSDYDEQSVPFVSNKGTRVAVITAEWNAEIHSLWRRDVLKR